MSKKIYNQIKRDRFTKIASRRVQRVLDDIDSLAKCSNRGNYDYIDSDVRKMMLAIKTKLRFLEASFSQDDKSDDGNLFKF